MKQEVEQRRCWVLYAGLLIIKGKVAQSCLTLCDSMDCSLPGFSGHGILQARVLEWVAISFSRGSSWPRDPTWVSRIAGRRFTHWATREALRDPKLSWTFLVTCSKEVLGGTCTCVLVCELMLRSSDTWYTRCMMYSLMQVYIYLGWWSQTVFCNLEYFRPGMLQSMGLQRIGHDWGIELRPV